MTKDYDRHLEALKLNWKIIYLTSRHVSPKRIDDTCEQIADLLLVTRKAVGYIPLAKRRMP